MVIQRFCYTRVWTQKHSSLFSHTHTHIVYSHVYCFQSKDYTLADNVPLSQYLLWSEIETHTQMWCKCVWSSGSVHKHTHDTCMTSAFSLLSFMSSITVLLLSISCHNNEEVRVTGRHWSECSSLIPQVELNPQASLSRPHLQPHVCLCPVRSDIINTSHWHLFISTTSSPSAGQQQLYSWRDSSPYSLPEDRVLSRLNLHLLSLLQFHSPEQDSLQIHLLHFHPSHENTDWTLLKT